jgi:hypothetical protein
LLELPSRLSLLTSEARITHRRVPVRGDVMDLHNDLFEGPPPAQSRTAPLWPGYDPEPVRHGRRSLFGRLFGAQRRTRRTVSA